jgi:hypothetical protein
MTGPDAQAQVITMLEAALLAARTEGAIACEIMLLHNNTLSRYSVFNDEGFADAYALLDTPDEGRAQ